MACVYIYMYTYEYIRYIFYHTTYLYLVLYPRVKPGIMDKIGRYLKPASTTLGLLPHTTTSGRLVRTITSTMTIVTSTTIVVLSV